MAGPGLHPEAAAARQRGSTACLLQARGAAARAEVLQMHFESPMDRGRDPWQFLRCLIVSRSIALPSRLFAYSALVSALLSAGVRPTAGDALHYRCNNPVLLTQF